MFQNQIICNGTIMKRSYGKKLYAIWMLDRNLIDQKLKNVLSAIVTWQATNPYVSKYKTLVRLFAIMYYPDR